MLHCVKRFSCDYILINGTLNVRGFDLKVILEGFRRVGRVVGWPMRFFYLTLWDLGLGLWNGTLPWACQFHVCFATFTESSMRRLRLSER